MNLPFYEEVVVVVHVTGSSAAVVVQVYIVEDSQTTSLVPRKLSTQEFDFNSCAISIRNKCLFQKLPAAVCMPIREREISTYIHPLS